MAVFVFMTSTVTSYAEVTEESIKAKENQISEAKKERDSLKNAKTDLEKVKKELETSKSNLNNYITQLDGKLTDIQEKIDSLNNEITEKEQEIETTTQELIEAEAIQKAQYEAEAGSRESHQKCGTDSQQKTCVIFTYNFYTILNEHYLLTISRLTLNRCLHK